MNEVRSEAAIRLGVRHAIIQGPFGGGLSTPRLTSAVSNLGGLGSYGAHIHEPEEIMNVVSRIRALTSEAFSINLWVSDSDPEAHQIDDSTFLRYARSFAPYFEELGLAMPSRPERFHPLFAEQVEALIEARPPAFSFVFGIPSQDILARCRSRGIVTLGTATTLAEARALDEAGVDAIVVSGFEAGGHRTSFLERAEDSLIGTFSLTQVVAPRVRAPVIAAGGVVDARGIRAVRALGAAGAQVGTAFLACEESGTTDAHRDALFGIDAQSTTLTRAYTGRLARGMVNRATTELLAPHAPFPVQSFFFSKLKAAAMRAGRTDWMSLYASQSALNLVHRSAPALMAALLSD